TESCSRTATRASGSRWTRSRTSNTSTSSPTAAAHHGAGRERSQTTPTPAAARNRDSGCVYRGYFLDGCLVLRLPLLPDQLRRILLVGSHSDDIEIGCGATLLALTRAQPELEVTWVVLGAQGMRETEARESGHVFLESARRSNVIVHGLRDGFFPYLGGEIKDIFEDLKTLVDPDIIFTHNRHDLHQDHRLVCELTWNTWRNH